ncbi:MAG: HIT domain-containing protein [Candidatus Woesearchaeota archaeon]
MSEEQLSPQEAYEKQKENCIFCKIISGDIPSNKIYEDNDFIGILDINPASKGHVVVIPKEHMVIMPQMNPDITGKLGLALKNVSTKIIKNLGCSGTSIFIANGAVAGQKSPHFITHIIPRDEDDGISLNPDIKKVEGYKETIKKISAGIGQQNEGEILLEDDDLGVICPENAFVKGHLIIAPKQKYVIIEEIPEQLIKKIFQVSNKLLSVLFDNLGCHGTNILIQNGLSAGQTNSQFSVNIIPRFEEDGLGLSWSNKQMSKQELEEVEHELKEAPKINKTLKIEKEDIVKAKEPIKESYLTKSLNRLP